MNLNNCFLVLPLIMSVVAIVVGVVMIRLYATLNLSHREAVMFDLPGRCSVVHFNCTMVTISLFVGNTTNPVRLWDHFDESYFCGMPSISFVPCYYSHTPGFSMYVRMGPVPPYNSSLLVASIMLVVGGAFIIVILIIIVTLCRQQLMSPHERLMGEDAQRQDRGELTSMPQGPVLSELHPLEDRQWKEKVLASTEFSKRRLEILARFIQIRCAGQREEEEKNNQIEPMTFNVETDSSVEFDDDDMPVDECYVCLSRFRRRLVWWPCGHWMCPACTRKILRRASVDGYGTCPNCRHLSPQSDIVFIYIRPRSNSAPLCVEIHERTENETNVDRRQTEPITSVS